MNSYYSDPSGYGALLAFFAVFGFIFFLFAVAVYVVSSFFYMKLFEKAGVEGKWRGWVPVYREMIFAKLGDLSPWWVLALIGASFVLNLIPYLGAALGWLPSVAFAVYLALAAYRIQLKLQKEWAWLFLFVLVHIVWLGVVALDRSRWNTAVAPAPWANTFLADNTVWQGVPVQNAVGGYAPPTAPGYDPPTTAGYAAPGAYPPPTGQQPPAPGYAAPPVPPTTPPAPPAAPPAEPPAAQPPVPPVEPTDPPATPPAPPAEPPRS